MVLSTGSYDFYVTARGPFCHWIFFSFFSSTTILLDKHLD